MEQTDQARLDERLSVAVALSSPCLSLASVSPDTRARQRAIGSSRRLPRGVSSARTSGSTLLSGTHAESCRRRPLRARPRRQDRAAEPFESPWCLGRIASSLRSYSFSIFLKFGRS